MKGQVLDPSRSLGMTVIQRSRLGGSSTGGCSIFDRVSGPRSGLCEDFIEMEKGIGNLEEVCEGASPRSLAEPRDDSYAKVPPRRIHDRVNGPARLPLNSGSGAGMTVKLRCRGGRGLDPGPGLPFYPPEADFQLGSRPASAGFQLGGSSTGGCSIFDRVSGLKSSLCEDFIEMEKGIGNLGEGREGASPRSLAGPRDDSYTKVTPRRIHDSSRDICTTTDCLCCTVQIT